MFESKVMEVVDLLMEDIKSDCSSYEDIMTNKFLYAYKKGSIEGRVYMLDLIIHTIEQNLVETMIERKEDMELNLQNFKAVLIGLIELYKEVESGGNDETDKVYSEMSEKLNEQLRSEILGDVTLSNHLN